MPTSSDEMRHLMSCWFGGNGIADGPPIAFLESRGYKLTPGWTWQPPVPHHTVSQEEKKCIIFLIEEWDFGGLE